MKGCAEDKILAQYYPDIFVNMSFYDNHASWINLSRRLDQIILRQGYLYLLKG